MLLKKDQVNAILKNAPAGADKKAILDGLIIRGYDLEGVDSNAVRQSLQKEAQPVEEKGTMDQLKENLSDQNIINQTMNRGKEVMTAIENQPKLAEEAGGGLLAKAASIGATAGHIAGTVARGVGDMFGAILSPFIPKQAQEVMQKVAATINEKVDSIPGMTPEIKKSLEDVFDTSVLLGGKKAEPIVKNTVEQGAKNVVKTGEGIIENTKQTVGGLKTKTTNTIEGVVKKPIPEQVKTVLNEIDEPLFDKYANAAKKAALSNKEITPLELAGKEAQTALDTIKRKLDNIGVEKSAVIEKANIGLQDAGNVGVKLRQQLENYAKGNTLVGGDKSLVNDIISKAKALGANPKLVEVDKFIDYAQQKLYTAGRDLTVPITSKTPAFIRKSIGELNTSLKKMAGESYSGLNDSYSKLVRVMNELNTKLGKEGEKGGSLMKRVFSPSDANTKQLFQDVKEITGIDLVNESTIAKFVMEVMGDARQLSLLEELKLPKIASNPLDWIWDKITRSFNTPEKLLERARGKIQK